MSVCCVFRPFAQLLRHFCPSYITKEDEDGFTGVIS